MQKAPSSAASGTQPMTLSPRTTYNQPNLRGALNHIRYQMASLSYGFPARVDFAMGLGQIFSKPGSSSEDSMIFPNLGFYFTVLLNIPQLKFRPSG
jgi:hypothetical protein